MTGDDIAEITEKCQKTKKKLPRVYTLNGHWKLAAWVPLDELSLIFVVR